MGSREDVAARIEQDTKIRIEEMNKAVVTHKEPVSFFFIFYPCRKFTNFLLQVIHEILKLVYDIKPEIHKNYRI